MARIVWLQWTYLIPTDVLWNMNYLLTKLTSIVQQYVKTKCFMTQTEKESTFTNQKSCKETLNNLKFFNLSTRGD